jgi:uncharacterized protein YfiM (DUF2279 family)
VAQDTFVEGPRLADRPYHRIHAFVGPAPGVCDPPAREPVQSTADRWFAADKAKHFLISYGLAGFAFAGSRLAGMDRQAATATALVAGLGAGVAKELADRKQGKGFSPRDLAWDAAGLLAGVLVMQRTN